MPYTNVPKPLWGKMDRCVQDVMRKQKVSKERAIAICHGSVVGDKEVDMSNARKKRKKASLKEEIPVVNDLPETPVEIEGIEEPKESEEPEESIEEDGEEKWFDSQGRWFPTFAATSFPDLDAARQANAQAETFQNLSKDLQAIINNILYDEDIEDKAAAISQAAEEFGRRTTSWQKYAPTFKESLGLLWQSIKGELTGRGRNDLPDSAFAYIEPGGKKDEGGRTVPRSLRHYPIHDAAHARNALARAGAAMKKGGKTAEIARKAMPKIRSAAKKFGIKTESKDNTLTVFKDNHGTWRWLGIFSNNFQDRSREILTDEAHKEYIAFLDANPEKAPFFCPWHTWDLRRKHAIDFWDYAEGFMLVGGRLEEDEAVQLSKAVETYDLGMSHGFIPLKRDPINSQNIVMYRTIEVSDLPVEFADNLWTTLEVIPKEAKMNANKREYLVGLVGEEAVTALEAQLKDGRVTLESLGIPSKDAQPPADADDETQVPDAEVTGEEPPQDAKEFIDAVVKAFGEKYQLDKLSPFLEEMQSRQTQADQSIVAINKTLKEMQKSEDERIAEKITPTAAVLWGQRPSQSKDNVIPDEEAEKVVPKASWVEDTFGAVKT